jgi:hypothetical protein
VQEVAWSWSRHPSGQVAFRWNGQRFVRLQGGRPHTMEDGAVVHADNLVILQATKFAPEKKPEEWQIHIGVLGEGAALFLSRGKAWSARWRKAAPEAHFEYFQSDGTPLLFAPGTTWVAIVPSLQSITATNAG